MSRRLRSQKRNCSKGSVRDLWGLNFWKKPRKSASLPCPFKPRILLIYVKNYGSHSWRCPFFDWDGLASVILLRVPNVNKILKIHHALCCAVGWPLSLFLCIRPLVRMLGRSWASRWTPAPCWATSPHICITGKLGPIKQCCGCRIRELDLEDSYLNCLPDPDSWILNYRSGSGALQFIKDLKKVKNKYQYFITFKDLPY